MNLSMKIVFRIDWKGEMIVQSLDMRIPKGEFEYICNKTNKLLFDFDAILFLINLNLF